MKDQKKPFLTSLPRILLVDDNEHDRRFIGRTLNHPDPRFEIVECVSGESALDRLGDGPFDLVIVDLVLPGMDGIEFIRQAHASMDDAGMILLTGSGSELAAAQAVRLHVMDYIMKEPWDTFRDTLPRRVADAVREVGLIRENRRIGGELLIRVAHLEQIQQIMPDAVLAVIGEDRRVKEINEHAREFIDAPPSTKLIGETIEEVLRHLSSDVAELVEDHIERGQSARNYHIELRPLDRDPQMLLLNLAPVVSPSPGAGGRKGTWVLSIRDISAPRPEAREKPTAAFHGLIGRDPAILEICELIRRVAPLPTSVLIAGPTGSGKEIVARAIHAESDRSSKPFIAVNCTALSKEILESELFGHVRGAFTGAVANRKGRFREADGGTLLLDEIGDTSPSFQTKLLRTLDSGQIEPVGQDRPAKVDVRILCATNRNLEELVTEGKFREELFYRINVVRIDLPPLSARPGDLPLLIEFFRRELNGRFNKSIRLVTQEAMRALARYSWPGNVRELRHALEHAFVVAEGPVITRADLPKQFASGQHRSRRTTAASQDNAAKRNSKGSRPKNTPSASEEAAEKIRIQQALENAGWNRSKAAVLLNMHRATLWRKLALYGIEPPKEALAEPNPS